MLDKKSIIEKAKIINAYILLVKTFWISILIGFVLIVLFIGLSFTNRNTNNFITTSSIIAALTILLTTYQFYNIQKKKQKTYQIVKSIIDNKIIDYRISSKKAKIKLKDLQNIFKLLCKTYEIKEDCFKFEFKPKNTEDETRTDATDKL